MPSHKPCSVPVCPFNDYDGPRHFFPRDKARREAWLRACRMRSIPSAWSVICSYHFREEDYEKDLMFQLMGHKKQVSLNKDALPSLYLDIDPEAQTAEEKPQEGSQAGSQEGSQEGSQQESVAAEPEVSHERLEENPQVSCSSAPEVVINEAADDMPTANSNGFGQPSEVPALQSTGTQTSTMSNFISVGTQVESSITMVSVGTQVDVPPFLISTGTQVVKSSFISSGVQVDVPNNSEKKLRSSLNTSNRQLLKARKDRALAVKQCVAFKRVLSSKKHQSSICKDFLEKKFTLCQSRLLISGKRRCKEWGKQDIVNGLIMRSMSSKLYEYLRKNDFLKMPGTSTLKAHTKDYSICPGTQYQSLKILQKKLEVLEEPRERLAFLCFDEIELRKCYEFDQRENRVYGPYSKAQVAMLRGICSSWKQVIFVDFDFPMTKKKVDSLITAAEKHGVEVHGITMDLGNKTLMSEIDFHKAGLELNFPNDYDKSRTVHVFPDAPHLLKSLRNHILDHGLILSNGALLLRHHFQELVSSDSGEYQCTFKLNQHHLDVTHQERQRVRVAAQTLSHSVATAMKIRQWYDQAEIVQLVNDWFDVENSSLLCHKIALKCAFGHDVHYSKQLEVLDKTIATMKSMRTLVKTKNGWRPKVALQPFQIGIIISCTSIKNLFQFLKDERGIKFFMTARANQDCLENLFSTVRAITCSHPGPVQLLDRLRLLEIKKHADIIANRPSVELQKFEDDESALGNTDTITCDAFTSLSDGVVEQSELSTEDLQVFPED